MKTKIFSIMICILLLTSCNSVTHAEDGVENNNMVNKMMANSNIKPTVYFTKDITASSLVEIYDKLGCIPNGNVGVKISTGEPQEVII